jgi:hypothetical protein
MFVRRRDYEALQTINDVLHDKLEELASLQVAVYLDNFELPLSQYTVGYMFRNSTDGKFEFRLQQSDPIPRIST